MRLVRGEKLEVPTPRSFRTRKGSRSAMIGNQQKKRLQGVSGLTPLTEPVQTTATRHVPQLFKLKGPRLL